MRRAFTRSSQANAEQLLESTREWLLRLPLQLLEAHYKYEEQNTLRNANINIRCARDGTSEARRSSIANTRGSLAGGNTSVCGSRLPYTESIL